MLELVIYAFSGLRLFYALFIGDISRQKINLNMAEERDGSVETMEVDSCENEPSTSKAVTSTQPKEVKKSHHNLPW